MAYFVVDIEPGRTVCVGCQRSIDEPKAMESDERRGHWHTGHEPRERGPRDLLNQYYVDTGQSVIRGLRP